MAEITLRSRNLDKLDIGKLNAKFSARGDRILRYYIDIRHKTMNLHRELGAPELFILQSKVDALLAD
jgi:restriction system protein